MKKTSVKKELNDFIKKHDFTREQAAEALCVTKRWLYTLLSGRPIARPQTITHAITHYEATKGKKNDSNSN